MNSIKYVSDVIFLLFLPKKKEQAPDEKNKKKD